MFQSARLKLTFWYLLIVMVISASFSLVIHQAITSEIERFSQIQKFRIERRIRESFNLPISAKIEISSPDLELLEETKLRVTGFLMLINLVILTTSGTIGYFLAGKTLHPIKHMLDEQNRFVSDASHEIRTPLTSLKSSLEVALLDKKMTLNQARNLFKENIAEVDRLQTLSERMLQLTRFQNVAKRKNFERAKTAEIINQAVKQVTPIAKKKKILIETSLKDAEVFITNDQIIELLVILLDNAIKYSPEGSRVKIESLRKNGMVIIKVVDQGIGISPEDSKHVFDRFFRSDHSRARLSSEGGFGLGLAIAKQIVQEHQGTIALDSQIGKGSTFTVQLPCRPQPEHQRN